MAPGFTFDHHLEFHPEASAEQLRSIPSAPGVFALRGPSGEPYLTRTADLRRRLRRLLAPPESAPPPASATPGEPAATAQPVFSKRLNLRHRVRFIDYTRTGSEFESILTLYRATRAAFGPVEARRRLRLHPPFCIRITSTHAHPRVYVTNRLSARALTDTFGPFPSRAAAERYCDAVLDLFQLRRCHEDLQPHPDHPGCAYGEMNRCLAPCKQACTPDAYAAEAIAVRDFLATRGESLLTPIAARRDAASEAMDFELAATLHRQYEKVKAATTLADELVQPLPQLSALIVQESAPTEETTASPRGTSPDTAAVFLLQHGRITGPEPLSTLGVRAVREQTAVGSSLFAQPLMLSAVPLGEPELKPNELPQALPTTSPLHNGVISTEGEAQRSRSGETPVFADVHATSEFPPGMSVSPISEAPEKLHSVIASPTHPGTPTALSPEDRARATIAALEAQTAAAAPAPPADELADTLALFRRWYFRPEKQRPGEALLPNEDGQWPIRRLLNAAARVALGPPVQADAVNREAAREALREQKTKVIHPGREGVERTVPVLPKRPRRSKAITPADIFEEPR